jgi:hypothetical protein
LPVSRLVNVLFVLVVAVAVLVVLAFLVGVVSPAR